MALVRRISDTTKERTKVHDVTECAASVLTGDDGETYLQLDTFGSPQRAAVGTVSQILQFDENAARELLALIERAFPHLRDRHQQ